MSGRVPSPTVRRWRLARELRAKREYLGIPAATVAKDLGWGNTKTGYLENRHAERPKPEDVQRLCEYYDCSDEERDELLQLAIDSGIRGWWEPYKRSLPRDYTTFIGLEAEAAESWVFEPLILPGLLQTEEYARALILEGRSGHGAKEIGRRVQVRTERQKLLTAETDPLHLHAIVDEAAIRRVVGGPEVMRAQLRYLRELAALPNVDLQIVPFVAGAHPGVAGSFTVLRFRDERDDPVGYIETIAGDLFVEKEQEVRDYEDAFERLIRKALSHEATMSVTAAAAATI
jgi:transcriptional regulator with XRE-family HTH domain